MAHKKGAGSTDNGRDSNSNRLGVKLFGGQAARAGNIIIRQRGTKFHPGLGVGMGKDHTIYALTDGTVTFTKKVKNRTFVNVLPYEEVKETLDVPKKAKAKKAAPKKKPPKKEAPKKEEAKKEAPMKMEAPAPAAKKEDAPKKEAPKAKETAKKAPAAKKAKKDDLRKIEGIGPKIAGLLTDGGIVTFADLAAAKLETIQVILDNAGSRYRMHDPTTWPAQAGMAAEGKWDELKVWQDEHDGGRPKK